MTRADGDQVSVCGFDSGFADPGAIVNHLFAWGADWFDKDYPSP